MVYESYAIFRKLYHNLRPAILVDQPLKPIIKSRSHVAVLLN